MRLLQHQPLYLHIGPGVVPVAFGIHVAKVEAVLEAELDFGKARG